MKTNKIFITILFIFFTFFTSCEPFSETWDDFFETKCEKENTCSVTIINKGDLPIYVDVTYTDNMPNQILLVSHPGGNPRYQAVKVEHLQQSAVDPLLIHWQLPPPEIVFRSRSPDYVDFPDTRTRIDC